MKKSIGPLAAIAILGLGYPSPSAAQIPTGITKDVVSSADPSQRYAMFVPSAYRPDTAWPLVVVMDPRGAALVPLERMAGAAERLGYILLSSYNTASDSLSEPNELAARAMIDDAQELFTIDRRRLYFAGQSGTARAAWVFANDFAGHSAGVIGFGAGLPNAGHLVELLASGPPSFSFFGGAGETDYNYEEVRNLDWTLDDYDLPHVVEFFGGPHAWPDTAVFARALEWMDVRAVQEGRTERAPAQIAALYRTSIENAERMEKAGDVNAAWRYYKSAVSTFEGLEDTSVARERMERLAASKGLTDANKRLRAQVVERRAFDAQFAAVVEQVRQSRKPLNVASVARTLGLERLRRRAAQTNEPADAKMAQRMIENVFVRASFYRPRDFMNQGEFAIANSYLRLAATIKPDDPAVSLGLGRTYAQMGDIEKAITELERAVASGAVAARQLEADALLAPLRGNVRFAALLRRGTT